MTKSNFIDPHTEAKGFHITWNKSKHENDKNIQIQITLDIKLSYYYF